MYEHYLIVYALGAFILDEKNRLLIIKKSSRERIDAGLWVVPGGKVKSDEHIIDALKREVLEEVGLEVKSYEWIGEDVFKVGDKYFHAPHFICRVKSTKKIVLEKNMEEYRWITKKEMSKYPMPEGFRKQTINVFKKYGR